jgi:hypothetical protein
MSNWRDMYAGFRPSGFFLQTRYKGEVERIGFQVSTLELETPYYQKEGTNRSSMVELPDDSCVTKMLEEFEPYLAKNRIYVATWTRWCGPTYQNTLILYWINFGKKI